MKKIIVITAFIPIFTPLAFAQEIAYNLPEGTASAGYQARITKCPVETATSNKDSKALKPDISHNALMAGSNSPGELVRLNPRSPFLASRSIALTYHDNGMLKTINAEGEGKGGAIIASLLKTGAGILTFGSANAVQAAAMGGAQPGSKMYVPDVTCSAAVKSQVNKWTQLGNDIQSAEARIAAGQVLGTASLALYESQKKEKAAIEKKLTLSNSAKFKVARQTIAAHFDAPNDAFEKVYYVPPIDYRKWFEKSGQPHGLTPEKGQHGFCAKFSVSKADFNLSKPLDRPSDKSWRKSYVDDGKLKTDRLMNRFIYLRPVPLTAETYQFIQKPKATTDTGKASECKTILAKMPYANLGVLKKGKLTMPQLSGYFILPLGSGIFETKGSSAEFSKDGKLVSIGTKALGSGAGIGEALAGALTAAETVRDGRKNSIQREIDLITAENSLELLLEPGEQGTVVDTGI